MQTKWIEDLRALSTAPNLFKAAELRNSSHTAFSRRLRSLEEWVGIELLDRSAQSVRLNDMGERFLAHAEEAMAILETAKNRLIKKQLLSQQKIVIASGRTLSQTILPKVVADLFSTSITNMTKVVTTSLEFGIEMLKDSKADFLLCHAHVSLAEALNNERHDYIVVGNDVLVAVSAPDPITHKPLFSVPTRSNSKLTPYLEFAEGMSMRRILRDRMPAFCDPERLQTVYEADLAESIHKVSLRGIGLAWLPLSVVNEDIIAGRLVKADPTESDIEMEIRLYRLKDNPKKHVQKYWSSLQDMGSLKGKKSLYTG